MDSQVPSSFSALEQLSSQICSNANKLSRYLQSTGITQPSFESDTPVHVLPSDASQDAHSLRHKLKQDALKLFRLACGPDEYISHLSSNHQLTICLRYLCHFKVFSVVPTTGSISLSNVAIITSAPLVQLTSVIKMASTSGLFTVSSAGRVAHSAASRLITESEEFSAWAFCFSQHMFNASACLAEANHLWGRSANRSHSAFNMAFKTDVSFPDYLAQAPAMARSMGNFLKATQLVDANSSRHLVNGYDWRSLRRATVVDVNTTAATAAISLAKEFPHLSFELQVAPREFSAVKADVDALQTEIHSRFVVGTYPPSALQSEKGEHPKVFLVRHFLHNLPDHIALSILGNLVSSLRQGDKIIIQDVVLPGVGELDPYDEGMLRMRELIQVELGNGRIRDEGNWRELIGNLESDVKVISIARPEGSDLSLMEIGL